MDAVAPGRGRVWDRTRRGDIRSRAALNAFESLVAARDTDVAAFLREGVKVGRPGPRSVGTLTRREQEVFDLLNEGLSNPAIAERLFLSRRTVEHHVTRILSRLGLRTRAEASLNALAP
jgi:DNA-binding NarL/FixJ family response regulator